MGDFTDTEIIHSVELPEAAVPLAVCEIVEYLDEDGDRAYAYRHAGTNSVATAVGLLELAKRQMLMQADFGEDDDD